MELGAIICLVACIVISLTLLLLLISMDTIEPLQYGITVNKITKTIGTEVYESGRYLIGPFKSFLYYPANLIGIEFSDARGATGEALQTRTAEGLALTLYVSFQYQVNKTEIPKLYNLANVNYHTTYVRIARDIILKVGGQYNATNYWTDRAKIGEAMKEALDLELRKAYATCRFLQVLRIDLPKTYEDSIVATQVEVQKTNMRKFEQQAELIRQNISVIISEAEQQIKIVNATGNAEAFRIKQFATVMRKILTKFIIYFNFFLLGPSS
jgi:regulator of protease activity HflC (stomatin/prohibitin superfamily)